VLRACLEVRSPIVYATLIIVAASVPVFLLTGLTGAFFRPLALSYTLAIVASMAVALTLTPALALLLLRRAPIERRSSPWCAGCSGSTRLACRASSSARSPRT
jgi:Cu/Ag efflux pump CusA